MRLFTHFVFGAGSVAALAFTLPVDLRLSLAVATSLLVNLVVDELGHVARGGFAVRSPLTHSVFTAPMWGGAVGYVLWVVGSELGLLSPGPEAMLVVLCVVVAYSHLLLDSMTEGGVYFTTRRIAVSHFSNGNVLLNAAFVLCGLALFLL